jgi:cytochrome c oxidase subunit III
LSEPTPGLAHHFDDLQQQHEAGSLGMWLFLVTEILFFGGLFAAYTIYRGMYPEAFAEASHETDLVMGTVNTAILLGSSLTMALAVHSAQKGSKKAIIGFLVLTMILGMAFLGIKSMEYYHKIMDNHFPGPDFHFDGPFGREAQLFFIFYFTMTGMHALHMIIGVGLMIVIGWMAWRERFSKEHYAPVEIAGLYWHFVDIVWIFLFPLLYLIDRHK